MNKKVIINLLSSAVSAVTVACAGLAGMAQAEDIDIFQVNPEGSTPPNILFIIDNTANWDSTINDATGGKTTKRIIEHLGLADLFSSDRYENRINVGFMVFSDANPDGGKMVKPLQTLDSAYRSELRNYFATGALDKDEGLPQSNNASYALAMHEAYLMFSGGEPFAGNPSNNRNEIQPDDRVFDASGNYIPPAEDACHDYIVIVGNGAPDNGENSGSVPERKLAGIGGNTAPISLNPDGFEAIWADEFSRFFNSTDVLAGREGEQRLGTYVIHARDPEDKSESNNKQVAARALLKSIASQTGPGAYQEAHSAEDFKLAVQSILDEVLDVNSVFAASALPVSVNVRGTNLNQVYLGLFRPDALNRTRWYGNLKLLQLNVDDSTDDVFIADIDGDPAQNPLNGFINSSATSFWTHDSLFWNFAPRGTPTSGSDSPDGEVVEKGGVAQGLRELGDGSTPPDGNPDSASDYADLRSIYTCTGSCSWGNSLKDTPFNTSNPALDAAAFDVASDAEADSLVDWVLGEDNNHLESFTVDEDNDGLSDDARPSLHGDVLHSQPAVVNYGGNASLSEENDVVVFYGANDGLLHAVRGGVSGSNSGQELWAFAPPVLFPKLKELANNTDGKTYFVDGNITTYLDDRNGDRRIDPAAGERVLLFVTLRRGGRALYALDVTDPDDPLFLWEITNDTPGFDELGQSWSDVRAGRLKGVSDPVAIFGAGYDAETEDADEPTGGLLGGLIPATRTQGRGLFAVNAITGAPIWQAGPSPDGSGGGATQTVALMTHSMAAPPTVIDRDRDGFIDRVYIPDTGGKVWRVNLNNGVDGNSSPNLWNAYLLASVGSDQKFLYAVDAAAAPSTQLDTTYDAVLVGSGNRADPFDTSVNNHFYMFKDRGNALALPIGYAELFDATDNLIQEGSTIQQTTAKITLAAARGWRISLDNPGEKVVTSATTVAGTTLFNTNQPPSAAIPCSAALGIARSYAVNYTDATATLERDGQDGLIKRDREEELPGGGFPPSPVPYLVEIRGEQYIGVVSGLHDTDLPNVPLGVRQRVFKYDKRIDQ